MRIDLGGGGWAEIADPKTLTPDQQDEYQDLLGELQGRAEKAALAAAAAAYPGAVPDPDEPPPSARLPRRDLKLLHDLVCGWVVQEVSYSGILPWDPGSKGRLAAAGGLGAWNALINAFSPFFTLLTGGVPKEIPTSDLTSSSTSPADATAPPAASATEPSATPAG